MAETVYVQNDDGTLREVTDEAEIADLHARIIAGELETDVESDPPLDSKRIILNAANAAAQRQFDADHIAAQAIENAKKVVVTVDDDVMPATVREITLQGAVTEGRRASVKARVAQQEGVTPAQVRVETREEHQARIASE